MRITGDLPKNVVLKVGTSPGLFSQVVLIYCGKKYGKSHVCFLGSMYFSEGLINSECLEKSVDPFNLVEGRGRERRKILLGEPNLSRLIKKLFRLFLLKLNKQESPQKSHK